MEALTIGDVFVLANLVEVGFESFSIDRFTDKYDSESTFFVRASRRYVLNNQHYSITYDTEDNAIRVNHNSHGISSVVYRSDPVPPLLVDHSHIIAALQGLEVNLHTTSEAVKGALKELAAVIAHRKTDAEHKASP